MERDARIIIVSAPSGAGKTTIVRALVEQIDALRFSISATTRAPRDGEREGYDYYFLTEDAFKARAAAGEFVEWEEVYPGKCYGTLASEVKRIAGEGGLPVFDVDVYGALNLKRQYGGNALAVFIEPPSLKELGDRLRKRDSETEADIRTRLARADEELALAEQFDVVVPNNDLEEAVRSARTLVEDFIQEGAGA